MTIPPQIKTLLNRISADPDCSAEAVFSRLSRLLEAPAPSNSCLLPGAVGPVIQAIAAEYALDCRPVGATGNLGIEIGDPAAELDLLVSAHMDRPCFRVLDLSERSLYPLCAIRVPGGEYECEGVALRYTGEELKIAARGRLHFRKADDGYHISFRPDGGELRWGDTVAMRAAPEIRDGRIVGAGLDNAIGVLLALLSAYALSEYAPEAIARRKILFAFTEQEEGPPIGLFGQGAARLAHVLPPPGIGFINIDGHNVDERTGHRPGVGASHAFVSGYGRGSVVPMNYQALAESLASEVNDARPGTARLNYSYVSRSDDMLLATWSRPVGLTGAIVANAHTTEETAALNDIVAAAHWIPAFIRQVL